MAFSPQLILISLDFDLSFWLLANISLISRLSFDDRMLWAATFDRNFLLGLYQWAFW
jgi:hypothetical protein